MSISITNSLQTSTTNTSLAVDANKNVEPLAVRVMRLSKPALSQNIPIYAEEESSPTANAFLAGQSRDIGIGTDHSVLSHLLVLPYSFGYV